MIDGKLHDEIAYKGKMLVIDTCDLGEWYNRRYETMAYLEHNGDEIDCVRSDTMEGAERNHRLMLARYKKQATELKGKYAKLRDDLIAAYNSTEHLESTEDGGTCNFDSPALVLPRWNSEKIKQAAKEAGGGAWKWELWGHTRWVFSFPTSGQANRRSRRAEAIIDFLRSMGYECLEYCAMD